MTPTLRLLALLAALLPAAVHAAAEDELLEADAAFAFSARMAGTDRVVAEWTIADGYYMYRDKFRFTAEGAGVRLGEPRFPKGQRKKDEFFGDVETYRKTVRIEIPLKRDAAAGPFVLRAVSQGCADIGVCYVPHAQEARLTLAALTAPAGSTPLAAPAPQASPAPLAPPSTPASSPAPAPAASESVLGKLARSLGIGQQEEFLDPDVAYRMALRQDGAHLVVRFDIEPGYYLYRDKFRFTALAPEGASFGEPVLPAGKIKEDPYFGRMEVYYGEVEARVPVGGVRIGEDLAVRIGYQGCADAGLCYPPIFKEASLTWADAPAAASGERVSEQDRLADLLAGGDWLAILPLFFGFGLLLAFTPCVLPMVPILSGIIVGQGHQVSTGRAFMLSLVYVLAMALTYTAAGVAAGLFGGNLQAFFQEPWILITFSLIFVALALSMFGFYELQMPSALQSRLTEMANRQRGGQWWGVAVMGFLSALIVGPCVAAPLAGALLYIGQSGDAVLGGAALFALSLGMGAPLLAIGASAGRLLPRAGAWMDAVKAFFGVLLLAVAIWMLERILPAAVTMLLWAALAILSAVYLGALESVPAGASGWRRLWKGIGLMLLVWGVLLLIGAASGAKNPLAPLERIAAGGGGASTPAEHLAFERFKSLEDLQRRVAEAAGQGRPVMVDFYADWCVTCKELERYTFSDPGVQGVIADRRTLLLQADVTANDALDQALMKGLGIVGPPTILFYGPDGRERRGFRLVGFLNAADFRAHAESALGAG